MKKLQKFLALLTCTSLLAMSVACGGGHGGQSSNGGQSEDVDPNNLNLYIDPQTEGELTVMVPAGNQNERTMIDCIIDEFALLYPKVEVKRASVSVDLYVNNVRNQVAAGTLPDIIWSNSPDFYDVVEMGAIENLTPYIEALNF